MIRPDDRHHRGYQARSDLSLHVALSLPLLSGSWKKFQYFMAMNKRYVGMSY